MCHLVLFFSSFFLFQICLFAEVFDCPYQALICDDTPACRSCLAAKPTADHALIHYTPNCKLPLRALTRGCTAAKGYAGYIKYLSCPDSVAINNRVVIATSVFGVIGLIAALSAAAVIYGYRKDTRSLRERILFGIMFGNAIYSLTNTIPVGYESTAPESCGNSLMASSEGAIRGMWFWGKYTMVPYELFIIAASIVTLKTGSINVPWKFFFDFF